MKNIYFIILAVLFLFSCEDKVDISKTLSSGKTALVVDGFINNLREEQVIKLNTTQYYFDNSGPKPATGATVSVVDLRTQHAYSFTEIKPGEYVSAAKGDSMLQIGNSYQLIINYQNQTYTALSTVNRVVPIDSLIFQPAEDAAGEVVPDKFNAEFFATDSAGPGDRYWIRHYRNGGRQLGAGFIGIGYDASSFSTGITDGIQFILPLRQFYINEGELEKKWKTGETVMVELYSISQEAAFFLAQVLVQSTLGNNGPLGALFSAPPANVPTNIKNTNENGDNAVGFFCTSAVSRMETTVPVKKYR